MKRKEHGARVWYVPDGYMPHTPPALQESGLISHEAICIVNPTKQRARVTMTVYFEDRDPLRDIHFTVGAERSLHVRLDKPEMLGGKVIPFGIPYSLKVESDVPIIAQHSRLDITQPNLALFTTIPYYVEDD